MAREPHDNRAGEYAEYDLGEDSDDIVADAVATLSFKYHSVNGVANDARKEHHEGIHHALNQGQSNHVAIGDVSNLMGQHSAHFTLLETTH